MDPHQVPGGFKKNILPLRFVVQYLERALVRALLDAAPRGMALLRGRGDVGLAAATRARPAQHARTGVHSMAPEPEGLD